MVGIKKVCQVVENILRADERARNDDKYLTFKTLQYFLNGNTMGDTLQIQLIQLDNIPAFASVKRARAFIQNKHGRFLPTDERVRHRRHIAEKKYHQWSLGL